VIVEMEPTTACDLACVFCPRASLRRPAGRLSEVDFQSILENLGHPSDKGMLLFSGFGEPMQHEGLAVFVRQAKRAGWFCGITTNGTRLSEPSAEALLSAGLDVLQVSLHGVTKATYGRVVKRGAYDEVVSRVESILSVCAGKILLALNFTVTPWNREERGDFASYWRERGISHINFAQCHNRGGHFQGLPRASNPPASASRAGTACWTYRNALYVAWDGRLLACCNDLSGETSRGDLRRRSLREIRQKEKGREPSYDVCLPCDFPFR
jgi:MoaA/NifB/PqqE/SkfB family radical SAM enzyme